jgi:hypothetical protein
MPCKRPELDPAAGGDAERDADLARAVSSWSLDPDALPHDGFQAVCRQVWSQFLRPHVVQRRPLLASILPAGQGRIDIATATAWAGAFLQARVLGLPEAARSRGFSAAALQNMALQWLWNLCAQADPVGARLYTALGLAVRVVQKDDSARIAISGEGAGRPASSAWLRRGVLVGAAGAEAMATPEDLRLVLARRVDQARLVLGRIRLPRFLAGELRKLPEAWTAAGMVPVVWPGATLASIFQVLLGIADPARCVRSLPDDDALPGAGAAHIEVRNDAVSMLLEAQPATRTRLRRQFLVDVGAHLERGLHAERFRRCRRLASFWLRRWTARHWSSLCDAEHGGRDVAGWLLEVVAALEALPELPPLKTLALEFYGQDPDRPRAGDLRLAQRADDRQRVSIAIRDTLRQVYR